MAETITYIVSLRVAELNREAYGMDSTITLSVESGMGEVLKAAIVATAEQVVTKMQQDAAIG